MTKNVKNILTCQKGYDNIYIANKTKEVISIVNNKIKEIRLIKGISLSDLALKSGVSAGYICHLENGTRKNPSVIIMKKIAHALGKNITEVFNIE